MNELNLRKVNNEIIAPWEVKDVLTPGTIVLIATIPRMWSIEANKKNKKQSLVRPIQ